MELDKEHFGGVSFGKYIFVEKKLYHSKNVINHELGHSLQSLYLGPFYILIVGIPSQLLYWRGMFIYNRDKKRYKDYREKYFTRFPENWADSLGGIRRK